MTHYHNCQCYDCHKSRVRRGRILRVVIIALFVGLLALIPFALAGCNSTASPAIVESHQASFDQGEQNSGILSLVPEGAIITAHAHDRYNALVLTYGREFLPEIRRDYGVTPHDADYLINREALQKFVLMNTWHRMGREPKNK